jgi:hypothetical protein
MDSRFNLRNHMVLQPIYITIFKSVESSQEMMSLDHNQIVPSPQMECPIYSGCLLVRRKVHREGRKNNHNRRLACSYIREPSDNLHNKDITRVTTILSS